MNEYSEQRSQIAALLQKHRSEFSFCKQQITGYLLGLDLIITQIKEGRKWHEGETLLSLKTKVHFERWSDSLNFEQNCQAVTSGQRL